MPTRTLPAACPTDTLLVMLPGAYSDIDEFENEGGYLTALRERRIAADVVLADAHMAYYFDKSIVDRLREDVMQPARAAGYRQVWIAGISLGGFGALLHEQMEPGQTAGLLVIAPYLGEKPLLSQIERAGSLARWQAPAGPQGQEAEVRIWRWMQRHLASPAPQPPLYLAFATRDRMAQGHALLASALPPDRVFTTPGGHDWPEWRRLWLQALDTLPLPRCAS